MKIINFGSLNIDHVYQVSHFVTPGETIAAKEYNKNPGGKGMNQSIALARAGATVYHAGKIGNDGLFLKEMLEDNGVNTSCLRIGDVPTGHAMIQVDPSGQNCILIFSGANGAVSEEEIRAVFSQFEAGTYVLLQNEIVGIATLITAAKDAGLKVILNPSPINEELLSAPLDRVDYFIFNEIEGAALTGKTDFLEILDAMREMYPNSEVVLTMGSKGAMFDNDDLRVYVPAQKAKAVDTTAAGDTFTGYFFASYLAGEDPQKALELAAKAAAITVSRHGAAASIPSMKEI